jgi:hypothetical protein
MMAVLYSAPPIPAGIWSFQWNSGGINQNKVEISDQTFKPLLAWTALYKIKCILLHLILKGGGREWWRVLEGVMGCDGGERE